MNWKQVLQLMARVCADQGNERRVLVVLGDSAFHVVEVLSEEAPGERDLLGFVVYRDDPQLSKRTEETRLLFVRPEQVVRVLVDGGDPAVGSTLGFG